MCNTQMKKNKIKAHQNLSIHMLGVSTLEDKT